MASDINDDDDVEESYKKFVKCLHQYLSKPIEDFASVKPEILSTLKTHRPIKVGDYQYGISRSLKKKSQLIVHEFNNRSSVREYFNSGRRNLWHCCECNRTTSSLESDTASSSESDNTADLLIQHGILFVKLEHDCHPREYSFVLDVQKFYKEKKMEDANTLQKSILGSEDTPPVGTNNRARSKQRTKEIDSEIAAAIKEAQENDEQELQTSAMDEQINEFKEKLSPEAAFAKLIENLAEYTSEQVEAVLSNKTKFLSLLKDHHPVKMGTYKYGLTTHLAKNKRLIVFEWNDKRKVREYSQRRGDPNLWECLECRRRLRTTIIFLTSVNGIMFLPNDHDCPARDYLLVKILQNFLENGDTTKALNMLLHVNFTYGEDAFANAEKHLYDPLLIDNNGNLHVKRKMTTESENLLPERMMVEVESHGTTTSLFFFEKPSRSKLKEICRKLNIEYRNETIKLWDKILIEQIDITSTPINIQIHESQTDNFYEILSKLFAGKSRRRKIIKTKILEGFREKLVSSDETMKLKKFNFSYTVTDDHLYFIAEFLECRILIFEGQKIRKYGKWDASTDKQLTLVLSLSRDGYYSIVLKI